MFLASDNTSGAAPEVMDAIARANQGYAASYGADAQMAEVTERIRAIFEAPEAAVYLVATGTVANVLSLATICPPWGAVFCHAHAHIAEDECGAPEFYTGGSKLVLVPGEHGRMTPETLRASLETTGVSGVHGVQRGALSITNVTEAGTIYTAAETAALTAEARRFGLPVHLDGARFANAVAAGNASPADLTWRAGVDILSFGGTKNGCLGVEAVVLFDPAKSWEFELRRKRGGHLFSKHRFLSAQMAAWLADGLWLRLAAQANGAADRLARGLAGIGDVRQIHPVQANMMFVEWPAGTAGRLRAAGAAFYGWDLPDGREGARLVTSWSTTDDEVDRFLAAI